MSFKGENAYKFTKKISFPRLIGSDGWLKARDIIKKEFESYGYEIETQKFKSSMFLTNVLLRVLMIPLLVILSLIIILYYLLPFGCLILSIVILCLIPFIGKYASSGGGSGDYKEPKEGIDSENIYVNIISENSKVRVFFMGHYDTKSQVLSIITRVICYVLVFIGGIAVCVLGLIGSIFKVFFLSENIIITWTLIICSIIAGVAAILLALNAVQNKSPGSLDNGTSVSTVVELSRVFKENPPKNIDLTFLTTDAEEQGVLGASAFISRYKDELDKEDTYFINFEAVGAKDEKLGVLTSFGMPKKQYTSKKLNNLAFKAADTLDLDVKKQYWPIGLLADHNPIMNHGFKATMLGTMAMGVGIHTSKDTMENVSEENLEIAGKLCVKIIELFDEELS
jgi:hypothetical protein